MTDHAFPYADQRALIYALLSSDLPPLAQRVGVYLVIRGDHRTGLICPSTETIAADLGSNRRTVIRAIRDHLEGRFFTVQRPTETGRGRSTRYHPIKQKEWPPRHPSEAEKGGQADQEGWPDGAQNRGHAATRTEEITDYGTEGARARGSSNSDHHAKPSKSRARHGPSFGSARGARDSRFSLADAALEYLSDEGE